MDYNKMTLDEVISYSDEMERHYNRWLTRLFVRNEGFENAVRILAENGRI